MIAFARTSLWAVGYLAFVAGAIIMLIPMLWMLSTSLKELPDVFKIPIQWIPRPPHWEVYAQAWTRFPFERYFLNSLIVTGAVTFLNVLLAGFAGYALAKYNLFGRRALFLAILSTLMLPIEVLMVPTFLIVKGFGWVNTYQGLIVPVVADAFGVFLMRQFMLNVPDALLEAARIDGAGELGTYFRIVLPLVWPAVLTLTIFTWRETWDAFVWPFLIVTEDHMRTIPLGLQRFQEQYVTTYNEVMAVSTLAMIPLVLMFFFFQRAFIRGIALSGLKD